MSLLQIKNLSYRYPLEEDKALRDINVTIEKGKLHTLIGQNGAGKTTLCNVIRGFIPHFYQGDLHGDVLLEGRDIRQWSLDEIAPKVGYVFQNPFSQVSGTKDTVYEEIAYGLENLGVDTGTIREEVNRIIKLFNINALADKNPYELSGGQKQRVALASIIVMDPDILVIDEPTSQLDPQGTEDVFHIIRMMRERGKTIILVEHKIDLIAEFSDIILLMHEGEIVKEGRTNNILTNPDVLDYKGALPQYALLGIEMQKKGIPIDQVPYTKEGALQVLNNWMQKKGKIE